MIIKRFVLDNKNKHFDKEINVAKDGPSNIALVKYWGKRDHQIPENTSLSFALSKSVTRTQLKATPKLFNGRNEIILFFEGEQQPSFEQRVSLFFDKIAPYCPYLKHFRWVIHTENTFPYGSGIASSASAMSALTLCLMDVEMELGYCFSDEKRLQRASFLARLGSGSACRSIYKGISLWGVHKDVPCSSDLYAIKLHEINPIYKRFLDTILLIDRNEKTISSSMGHELMKNHPYAKSRYNVAQKNTSEMLSALKTGDLAHFGRLIEQEALNLHSLMMSSADYFMLMKPNTLAAIYKIWDFRRQTKVPLYFTLDAGANLHLLYPETENTFIQTFIRESLLILCPDKKFISDHVCFINEVVTKDSSC